MTRSPLLRRTLAVALAASLAALGACGDDDNGDDEATATTAADSELTVADVWVRPATDLTASDRTAIYLQITAGEDGDELVSASVPDDVAGTVELHETSLVEDEEAGTGAETEGDPDGGMDGDMGGDTDGDMGAGMDGGMDGGMDADDMGGDMAGGVMQMREVDSIVIPAGETVSLEPGGLHIMLLDLQTELEPGDTIEVTLVFAEAGEMTVTAEVREP